MNETAHQSQSAENAKVTNPKGRSPIVLVCEHASFFIPPELNQLGLSEQTARSHAAWDPGAYPVAKGLSQVLDAILVAATVSRLVYDCNRPPDAPGAMTALSERIEVPGNANLSKGARAARITEYYRPFEQKLRSVLSRHPDPILVTVHSFTPVYHGQSRDVEIGILHDSDTRLADAMLDCAAAHTGHNVMRNEPYGPKDGVTHTLLLHGVQENRANVMLEIRNDLIATSRQQQRMADTLAPWIASACAKAGLSAEVTCSV